MKLILIEKEEEPVVKHEKLEVPVYDFSKFDLDEISCFYSEFT